MRLMCPDCRVVLKDYEGKPWCPKCFQVVYPPVALVVDETK
jgi:hypothetical protein